MVGLPPCKYRSVIVFNQLGSNKNSGRGFYFCDNANNSLTDDEGCFNFLPGSIANSSFLVIVYRGT